jgi:hypothetical protein
MTTFLILLISFLAGPPVHTMDDGGSDYCQIIHENGTDTCK